MKWDAVEREIYILSWDFHSISKTLAALAGELHRERESGSMSSMGPALRTKTPQKKDGPAASQSDLF